jgi:hypothetical protein
MKVSFNDLMRQLMSCPSILTSAGKISRHRLADAARWIKYVTIIIFAGLCVGAAEAPPEIASPATATIPLKEILRLYEENAQSKKISKEMPPVTATVNKVAFSGRLLDNGIDITARYVVTILGDEKWVLLPLLELDPTVNISSLPKLENAVLCKKDNFLSIVTRKPGVYEFAISMIKWAQGDGAQQSASINYTDASEADLKLQFDEDLFRILGDQMIRQADGVLIYPQNNSFAVKWERRKKKTVQKSKALKRPPIESMVRTAHASSISTLEGRLITRVLYQLRFEGTKNIGFVIPAGDTLERVYLNGLAIPFKLKDNKVNIDVLPSRAGDQSGLVELVTTRNLGNYLLSGSLTFKMPKVSWPIHELFLDIHLPDVFNYERSGGSMGYSDHSTDAVYTYGVPQPGKKLRFHQHLVTTTAPSVTVDYSINLEDKYFNRK